MRKKLNYFLGVFAFTIILIKSSQAVCSSNSTKSTEKLAANTTSKFLPLSLHQTTLYQNVSCAWNISAPAGSLVKISIMHLFFHKKNVVNCSTEGLVIYDGPSELHQALFHLCFSQDRRLSFKKTTVFTTGRFSLVSLKISKSSVRPLLIWYEAVQPFPVSSNACNSSGYAAIDVPQNETVMSVGVNNYGMTSNGTICQWNITAPEFYRIKFWFSNTPEACEDLKVFDQSKLNGPSNKMANCSSNDSTVIYSSERNLLVEVKTSKNVSEFLAYFLAVKIPPYSFSCSEDKEKWALKKSTGVLASKDYPHPYPTSSRCTWVITVAQYQVVKLTFKVFSLQYSENCTKDYLKVSSDSYGIGSLGTFCGNSMPLPVFSTANEMYLTFRSDFSISASGFEAVYEAVNDSSWGDCSSSGTQLDGERGKFFSPRYPRPFPSQVGCLWQITVPPMHHVRLSFLHLNLGYCSSFNLTISEGNDHPNLTPIGSYCGFFALPERIMYSTGRQLWVHMKSDYGSTNYRKGFNAEFEAVRWLPIPASCSSNGKTKYMNKATGIIASEGFPNNYSNNVDCSFEIWVTKAETVTLSFEFFNLEPSHNCSSDYVEVFDGLGSDGPSLGRFCGSTLPPTVETTTNFGRMFVRFVSNSAGQYPGFKASYRTSYAMEPGILVMIILLSLFGVTIIFVVTFVLIRWRRSRHGNDGYTSAAVTASSDETKM